MVKNKIGTYSYPDSYDVIVVGAGHAGCEAALAAARQGMQTMLISIDLDTIAKMSCNPAIGGLAKGHIVREIDALGGEMGRVIDQSGIHFRMLNKAKGPAVWAPRAQADKKLYQSLMKTVLEKQENLDLLQARVTDVLLKGGKAHGVRTSNGAEIVSKTVIITAGTFLKGLLHVGMNSHPGGRAGDEAAYELSDSLIKAGLVLGRLKTGTPARVLSQSIDFAQTEAQQPDEVPHPFSFWTTKFKPFQIPCFITHTTEKTHAIIRENLKKSPMYSGKIHATGVRYCPSIEDKIVKFPDRNSHQIFLEPEGLDTDEIYVNGASTSLPEEVQWALYRSIIGMEKVKILRFAYAIEYDYANPIQLHPTLETKACENLFLAGQVNGTTGYEEAAAQGLMASINAVKKITKKESFILKRSEAYIGVLLDDLVTKGTLEPYRMFTSRAEYRLLLRQDNADERLTKYGHDLGLIDEKRYKRFLRKQKQIARSLAFLKKTNTKDGSLYKLLKRPENSYKKVLNLVGKESAVSEEIENVVTFETKYEGYLAKQQVQIEKMLKMEDVLLPEDFSYESITGLRKEAQLKLSEILPKTLGQAQRISGVTPADITVIMIHLKRLNG